MLFWPTLRGDTRRAFERDLLLPARWILVVGFCLTATVNSSHHESRLYDDLMRDYNILERPVENHSQPVIVYLKVSLQQLIDVDEKNQIVWCNAWLDYAWNDYKLRWEQSEYGNISDVRFPAGKIWKPDVLLYNSVDANFDSTYPTNMVVYHTGDVSWEFLKISCKIDIKWFPFDEQRCFFKFGSWSYNGYKIDLQPAKGGFDISEYLPNGEWALPMTTVSRSESFMTVVQTSLILTLLSICTCVEGHCITVAQFVFLSQLFNSSSTFAGFNLIMPCILTTTMSLLGFTLPPEAGEKITLQITVLLSICFFLSILSDMSPATSEAVPLLGLFFSSCMIVTTASTVFTVYVLNLHYRTPETHEMGRTARTILLYYLPYFLRMKRPGINLTWESLPPLLPCSKPKRHSESLMRNVKETEESGVCRTSFDIEQKVHQMLLMGSQQSNGGLDGGGKFKTTKLTTSSVPLDEVIHCAKHQTTDRIKDDHQTNDRN
uniref:Uncharacterized protein n=1 Tax=Ditylenchus dipsaci TaxID=166011 RepID=A0A915D2M6_9BILA